MEGAKGLRIGIIPTRQGRSDKVRLDSGKGLVICPLQHDADFMQAFYEGWRIVQAFLSSDATVPKEVLLPHPVHREICRLLEERREFPVVDVLEALKVLGQLELLINDTDKVSVDKVESDVNLSTFVAPLSRETD